MKDALRAEKFLNIDTTIKSRQSVILNSIRQETSPGQTGKLF